MEGPLSKRGRFSVNLSGTLRGGVEVYQMILFSIVLSFMVILHLSGLNLLLAQFHETLC